MSAPISNNSSFTGRNVTYSNVPLYAPPSSPALSYAYGTGIKIAGTTGNWVPLVANDKGALVVDIGVPEISVTGNVSIGAAVSISGGYIGITGQPILEALVTTTNRLVSGISGSLIGDNTYSSNFLDITASQTTIPAGTLSWSIAIQSGIGSINGTLKPAGWSAAGGGHLGKRLSNAIVVGITGGRISIVYDS